jgi:hypothetical protein
MLVNDYIRAARAADWVPPTGDALDALALPIKAAADDLYGDLVTAAAVLTEPAERMHAEAALKSLPRAITDHTRLGDALAAAALLGGDTVPTEAVEAMRRRYADAENQLERLRHTLIHLHTL